MRDHQHTLNVTSVGLSIERDVPSSRTPLTSPAHTPRMVQQHDHVTYKRGQLQGKHNGVATHTARRAHSRAVRDGLCLPDRGQARSIAFIHRSSRFNARPLLALVKVLLVPGNKVRRQIGARKDDSRQLNIMCTDPPCRSAVHARVDHAVCAQCLRRDVPSPRTPLAHRNSNGTTA